jgi:signal transduction histidine kinase
MHNRLLEAERLASLGEIVSGMAHEIRNPLMIMGGMLKRMRKKNAAQQDNIADIDSVLSIIGQMETMLKDMLTIPQDSGESYQMISMNDLLEHTLELIDDSLAEIKIEKNYDADIPKTLADERLLKQAFFNIMLNAVQAMDGKGRMILRTRQQVLNGWLLVVGEVEVSGGGIALDVMHNVFNPFFTTKTKGSGLGLSFSHKIVSSHNGIIEVHNQGDGAAFVIFLPAQA